MQRLFALLQDRAEREDFRKHLCHERCEENLLFVEAIEIFKSIGDKQSRYKLAKNIYENFLNDRSKFVLNVPIDHKRQVFAKLYGIVKPEEEKEKEIEKEKKVSDDIYDKILGLVYSQLVTDNLQRYLNHKSAAALSNYSDRDANLHITTISVNPQTMEISFLDNDLSSKLCIRDEDFFLLDLKEQSWKDLFKNEDVTVSVSDLIFEGTKRRYKIEGRVTGLDAVSWIHMMTDTDLRKSVDPRSEQCEFVTFMRGDGFNTYASSLVYSLHELAFPYSSRERLEALALRYHTRKNRYEVCAKTIPRHEIEQVNATQTGQTQINVTSKKGVTSHLCWALWCRDSPQKGTEGFEYEVIYEVDFKPMFKFTMDKLFNNILRRAFDNLHNLSMEQKRQLKSINKTDKLKILESLGVNMYRSKMMAASEDDTSSQNSRRSIYIVGSTKKSTTANNTNNTCTSQTISAPNSFTMTSPVSSTTPTNNAFIIPL